MKLIIFGAGIIGKQAISLYRDKISYVIDNNEKLHGCTIDGIVIKPVEELLNDKDYKVLIASRSYEVMEKQLDQMGITNYEYFVADPRAYYATTELIFNPYEGISKTKDSETKRIQEAIETINEKVEILHRDQPLFDHVEIETINRCNGVCAFCPVNINNDTRELAIMSKELFEKIIDELAELDYSGKLACFSNNEPFLDPNILERLEYARKKLPRARMHLFTNGTKLTLELFKEAIKYLDELIIDNYNQELKLIPSNKCIVDYCEDKVDLKRKVTVVLRKPNEILSSRGGEAPNKKKSDSYETVSCTLPYKQLIIRPTGEVSLCCNDPLGKTTMGDVNKEKIIDIWNGSIFKKVRECLYAGRGRWEACKYCDTINLQ